MSMHVLGTVAMEKFAIIVLMHVVVTVAMETIDLHYFNACIGYCCYGNNCHYCFNARRG